VRKGLGFAKLPLMNETTKNALVIAVVTTVAVGVSMAAFAFIKKHQSHSGERLSTAETVLISSPSLLRR
jgi:ABC-type amino acid transport system permease subunit